MTSLHPFEDPERSKSVAEAVAEAVAEYWRHPLGTRFSEVLRPQAVDAAEARMNL